MIGLVTDLMFDVQFLDDVSHAPSNVQRKVNRIIDHILELQGVPNSLNIHQAFGEDVYIGYVTRKKQHWRVLLDYDFESGLVTFVRLLTHKEMDRYL
jgi:hypothetical protein